ncbi:MAG: hypothetical protein ABUL77_01495 [Bacteroidota bacterium]
MAVLLGFASEFKVRQLERQGRLHAVRGAMGQAWYPRPEVLELRRVLARGAVRETAGAAATAGVIGESPVFSAGRPAAPGRWTDSALIAYLRGAPAGTAAASPVRFPTVVDLVADTGVSIARAERVYRFWLAHDVHPAAAALRARRNPTTGAPRSDVSGVAGTPEDSDTHGLDAGARAATLPTLPTLPAERRGGARIERDSLIRRLRDPDPAIRAEAFEKLKKTPRPLT